MKSLQASNGINNGSDGQEQAKEGGVGVWKITLHQKGHDFPLKIVGVMIIDLNFFTTTANAIL